MNTGKLLAAVKTALKWADGSKVKQELDDQILQLLGPKTEQDLVKPDKKKNKVNSLILKRSQSSRKLTATAPCSAHCTEMESTADTQEKKPKENGTVAVSAPANAEDTEAWRHADPYAFLPNPAENNKVHARLTFPKPFLHFLLVGSCSNPRASNPLMHFYLSGLSGRSGAHNCELQQWHPAAHCKQRREAGRASEGHRWQGRDSFPSRAQWVLAHRPCKGG